MMSPQNLQKFKEHAAEEFPKEACGFLLAVDGEEEYFPCRNLATTPDELFIIGAEDNLAARAKGNILAVCHSHPNGVAEFSLADRSACERSRLPWYVIQCPGDNIDRMEPSGFKAPLLERPFVHGVHDCYSIIQDYYDQELGVTLPHFERADQWWKAAGGGKPANLYDDNFAAAGFTEVSELRQHDVILMRVRAPVNNHAAVYIGDDKIIHHLYGQLSRRAVYGGAWLDLTTKILRHESQL
jgi:proteasome lid subunit RPN8/RPN11